MNNRSRSSKVSKSTASRPPSVYRSLVISALVVGGFLQLVAPVLANGTLAGTSIRNTATATYEDPTAPGVAITTTSNTVTVTVAEVAGITVTPDAIVNSTTPGGQILPGNNLFYDFRVTNVGNGDTRFYIPNGTQIGITGAGALTAGAEVQVSYNGGQTFVNLSTLTNQITAPVNPSASIIVRVPITANVNAPSGAAISVRLGDTGPNDNSAATQNQPDNADGSNLNEVRTVDADPTQAPVAPGEKEASAVQQILVGAQPQAFAAILKSRTNHVPGDPLSLTDDILTYGLSLRVDANAPAGSPGFVAANLTGTNINLSGTTVRRILVSDAIPAGTVLTGTPTPPSTPAGWVVVYSTNDPVATNLAPNSASVVWTTVRPTNAATIKRIGFIYDGAIAAGTTVTGFSFQVQTANVPPAGQSIENMAQVVGETVGALGKIVYDESGDQNPSNFNDNGTEGSNVPTNGVANSATQGVDPFSSDNDLTNDNQGVGPGGEVNVFVLLPPGAVLNGPQNQPGASGPTGTNDDFTNQALPSNVTPARGGTLAAAQTIAFTNTVQNPGTTALTDLLIVPRDIAQVAGINNDALPNGTIVQIVYGTTNATYTYNATTGVFTFTGGSGTTAVRINNLPAGQSVNYTVNVTLPAGTALSTDERTAGVLNGGYPVPVVAFSDTGTVNGLPDAGESQNLTINRSYLGYLRLTKDVRIRNASGTLIQGFTTTPDPANIVPGNILEYRISYQNISEASVGSGNVTLSANQVTITENGTVGGANGNNWALDNDNADGDGNVATGIDTSNLQGTATATQGTIVFNPGGDRSGPDQATDVTIYINNTGVVAPASTGTFTFRRRIN